jgi:hypothetical protein
MIPLTRRALAVGLMLVWLAFVPSLERLVSAQNAPASVILKIGGNVSTPLELTAADLKNTPRKL